jgi:hypothetical protein
MGSTGCEKSQTISACRQRADSALRERARRLHAEAVQLEMLADWAAGLSDSVESALYSVVERARY